MRHLHPEFHVSHEVTLILTLLSPPLLEYPLNIFFPAQKTNLVLFLLFYVPRPAPRIIEEVHRPRLLFPSFFWHTTKRFWGGGETSARVAGRMNLFLPGWKEFLVLQIRSSVIANHWDLPLVPWSHLPPLASFSSRWEPPPPMVVPRSLCGTYKDLLAGKLADTDGVWLPPRRPWPLSHCPALRSTGVGLPRRHLLA